MRVPFLFAAAVTLCAQSPSFEVATIKPSPLSDPHRIKVAASGGPGTKDPGRWTAENITVQDLILTAFEIQPFQVTGASLPGDRFDIQAKVPEGATKEQLQQMIQSLLAERFGLEFHRERKDSGAYRLVVTKGGPKLAEAKPRDSNVSPARVEGALKEGKDGFPELPPGVPIQLSTRGVIIRQAVDESIAALASMLARQVEKPVTDATGLAGRYDFVLKWKATGRQAPISHGGSSAVNPLGEDLAPDLMNALQEQLGLRLESAKGEVRCWWSIGSTRFRPGTDGVLRRGRLGYPSQHAFTRGRLGDRPHGARRGSEGEPGGKVRVGGAAAGHDRAAVAHGARELADEAPEADRRGRLPHERAGHHQRVAPEHRGPAAARDAPGQVLDAHQEAVLHRVHVDVGREGAAVFRVTVAHVAADRVRRIDASPPEELGAPGDVGVLAVDEEIGVEEAAVDRDVLDHRAAVEGGGGARAEHVLDALGVGGVRLPPAAVEVAHGRREKDAGGVDAGFGQRLEAVADREQLAADRARSGVAGGRMDQMAEEIGLQKDVRIQGQDPLAGARGNRPVLRLGESDVCGKQDHVRCDRGSAAGCPGCRRSRHCPPQPRGGRYPVAGKPFPGNAGCTGRC